jgi:LAS superfamily LD-carboxypeptidase LdcB
VKKCKFLWFPLALILLLCACGAQMPPEETGSGIFFYNENSEPLSGWQDLDGKRYYLDEKGQASVGIFQIDQQTYLFLPDGSMATGWTTVDGRNYYLRSNGTMVTGWFSLEGQRYYLTADGAVTGIREVDGKRYVFDKEGKLTSGWADLGGDTAYGDLNAHPITGWHEIDGKRFHFNDEGILSAGWITIGDFRYYFLADGSPAQGKMTIDGKRHTFASNGQELVLVNPWNHVPEDYTVELKAINDEHQIAAIAYEDYLQMMEDCRDAGMKPVVCSSYRTQEYQENLFRKRVEDYMEDGYSEDDATRLAGTSVAVPGTSEHQLGLAIDIVDNRNWNLDESQAKMPTQQWLMENSWRYGWILRYPNEKSAITGIIYEPWHYRYVGREIAAEIHELGLCLEEYLMMLTPGVG